MASPYSLVKTQAQWNILSTIIIATLLSTPIPAKIKPKTYWMSPLALTHITSAYIFTCDSLY